MRTVVRNVTTRVSFNGFNRLLEECPVATIPFNNEADRARHVALHAMICLYDLHIKVLLEGDKAWGVPNSASYRSYRPIDRMVALAIEGLTGWKSPTTGFYVLVERNSALVQIEEMRVHYWIIAFPNVPVAQQQDDFGNAFNAAYAKMESDIRRGLGNDALRLPTETQDFSLLHCGVLEHDAEASVVGYSELTFQSELMCRVLALRTYEAEGLAYVYVPTDQTDLDSIHFTSGYSAGRSWTRPEAIFQLKSVVSVTSHRVV